MKRILYFCLALTLFALFLPGCGEAQAIPGDMKELKEVADHYSLEDAKCDGYVIIEDGDVKSGEENWQSFVDLTVEKTPCKIRVVHYYTLGEPSHYEPEYYESIKDEYPKMYILELDYDGERFRVSHFEDDKLYQSEFKYLMKYEGEAETLSATYKAYVRYVLVNDDKVTWNDIMHGMLSSRTGDYIPHHVIYTDLDKGEEEK